MSEGNKCSQVVLSFLNTCAIRHDSERIKFIHSFLQRQYEQHESRFYTHVAPTHGILMKLGAELCTGAAVRRGEINNKIYTQGSAEGQKKGRKHAVYRTADTNKFIMCF